MRKDFFRKVMVFEIILLFVGASVALNISEDNGENRSQGDITTINSPNDSDWWPMYRHDAAHTGFSTSDGRDTNEVRWIFDTEIKVRTSPAIYDGKVYFGTSEHENEHNVFYCLDADSGTEVWSIDLGREMFSSPAVVNSKIYFGSQNNNVYCMDADDGSLIWTYDIDHDAQNSPTVTNGKVYIVNSHGKLYCLNAEGNGDGTTDMIWNFTTGRNTKYNVPTVADGKVYIGYETFYCLDAETGQIIWSKKIIDGGTGYTVAISNGRLYLGADYGRIYCLDANNGSILWMVQTLQPCSPIPTVAYGNVYFGACDYNLYCLDADDGAFIWKYQFLGAFVGTPSIADGKVYVTYGSFYCFNAYNGDLIWTYDKDDYLCGSPVIADGKIYIKMNHTKICCFGPEIIEPDPLPDLECHGSLDWANVTSGDTVTGSFTVENIGDSSSLLNWSVVEVPDWGNWTCEPSEGYELKPDDGEITVEVVVSAPEQQGMKFVGEIKIVNMDNSSDYDIIQVALSTPKNKVININPLFLRFLEQHFHIFPLLQKLLGL